MGGNRRRVSHQVTIAGNANFMSSEGWNRGRPGRSSHRWAPLAPTPITKTAISSKIANAKINGVACTIMSRLTCDIIAITPKPTTTWAPCRITIERLCPDAEYKMISPYKAVTKTNRVNNGSTPYRWANRLGRKDSI